MYMYKGVENNIKSIYNNDPKLLSTVKYDT